VPFGATKALEESVDRGTHDSAAGFGAVDIRRRCTDVLRAHIGELQVLLDRVGRPFLQTQQLECEPTGSGAAGLIAAFHTDVKAAVAVICSDPQADIGHSSQLRTWYHRGGNTGVPVAVLVVRHLVVQREQRLRDGLYLVAEVGDLDAAVREEIKLEVTGPRRCDGFGRVPTSAAAAAVEEVRVGERDVQDVPGLL
jgi:hypothetical protein